MVFAVMEVGTRRPDGQRSMSPHDALWTEEFGRYSAECRRMARLARGPLSAAGAGRQKVMSRRFADRALQMWTSYVSPSVPNHILVSIRRGDGRFVTSR